MNAGDADLRKSLEDKLLLKAISLAMRSRTQPGKG